MKKRKIATILFFLTTLPIMATQAFGESSTVLPLTVSGTIGKAPEWQNANGKISSADFAFATVAGIANQDVDSKSVQFKLVNIPQGPQNVALVLPSGCKIATASVNDSDVVLIRGTNTEIGSNQDITFTNDLLESFKLRFAAAGAYGDKDGAVTCTPGSMTFKY